MTLKGFNIIIETQTLVRFLRVIKLFKTYVTVVAQHNLDGSIMPLKFIWPDNRQFNLDKVVDVRMAPSLKAGGHGTRYTCRALGKEFYMFYDDLDGRWYIEH